MLLEVIDRIIGAVSLVLAASPPELKASEMLSPAWKLGKSDSSRGMIRGSSLGGGTGRSSDTR